MGETPSLSASAASAAQFLFVTPKPLPELRAASLTPPVRARSRAERTLTRPPRPLGERARAPPRLWTPYLSTSETSGSLSHSPQGSLPAASPLSKFQSGPVSHSRNQLWRAHPPRQPIVPHVTGARIGGRRRTTLGRNLSVMLPFRPSSAGVAVWSQKGDAPP